MMKDRLEQRFLQQAKKLWKPHTPLVLGLSGGIDSMALYALARTIQSEWPTPLHAVHINHQLRSSAQDEANWLCDYLAREFHDGLRIIAVNVGRAPGESLEMAARRVRYQALLDAADSLGPEARVAVAHQRDDQAETVLMRVLTGSGIRGLAAMRPVNGRVVRPLLRFSRGELEAYLEDRNIRWQEDPSNRDPTMLRNRIRSQLLPLLEETVNPAAKDALVGLADRAARHQEALAYLVDAWASQGYVWETDDALWFAQGWEAWPEELRGLLLRRFAEARGLRLGAEHLGQAFRGFADWPRGWRVERQPNGQLRVARASREAPDNVSAQPLPEFGTLSWGYGVIMVEQRPFASAPREGPWTAVGAGRWPRLWVRAWRPGDRIHPLGLGGRSKKLQDVWTDAKVPRALRRGWPLVVDSSDGGVVLAVPGIAASEEGRAAPGELTTWIRFAPEAFSGDKS